MTAYFYNCTSFSFSNPTNSFNSGGSITYSYFRNCTAGNDSFGYNCPDLFESDFVNCVGETRAFASGASTVIQGNDSALENSSVFFINCTAIQNSFGYNTSAYGTYINCVGAEGSFGGGSGTLRGILFNCSLRTWDSSSNFPNPSGVGKIVNSLRGNGTLVNLP